MLDQSGVRLISSDIRRVHACQRPAGLAWPITPIPGQIASSGTGFSPVIYMTGQGTQEPKWSWPSNAVYHARFRIYILAGLLNIMANAFEPGQAFWSSAGGRIPQSAGIDNMWNEAKRLAKAGRFTLWNVGLFHWTNREAYKGGICGARNDPQDAMILRKRGGYPWHWS